MSKKKRKEVIEILDEDEFYGEEFAYIAGYTAGGFPYGLRWEDLSIDPNLPLEEKQKLLADRDSRKNYQEENFEAIQPDAPVIFEDIVSKFEEISDSWSIFLNRKSGEFTHIPEDRYFLDYDEEDEEPLSGIEGIDWVRLPSQYDLYEYAVMRDFAETYKDQKISKTLLTVLRKKKPYRRFKDYLNGYGIAQQYYAYRREQYVEKAYRWCLDNRVSFRLKDESSLSCDLIEKCRIGPYASGVEELPF